MIKNKNKNLLFQVISNNRDVRVEACKDINDELYDEFTKINGALFKLVEQHDELYQKLNNRL